MPARVLTVAAVARIKPPQKGQADYFDQGFPGLALRVSYGGAKSWIFFYRLRGGKLRRLTLGRYPSMDLAAARTAWQAARTAVGKGESPANLRPASADSFAAVADEWLKRGTSVRTRRLSASSIATLSPYGETAFSRPSIAGTL